MIEDYYYKNDWVYEAVECKILSYNQNWCRKRLSNIQFILDKEIDKVISIPSAKWNGKCQAPEEDREIGC